MAKCVVVVLVLAVAVSGFGFCPIFHAYLGERVAHKLDIEGITPDIRILANAAYLADVMHLKEDRMHSNTRFTDKMMELARSIEELTFAMGFRIHQISDGVWVEFAARHGIPRGGVWTPLEIANSIFFCAYAVLVKGYVPPLGLLQDLPFYGGLIAEAYRAMYNEEISLRALDTLKNGFRAMLLGQYLLILYLRNYFLAAFLSPVRLGPITPGSLVRDHFEDVVRTVEGRAKMSVESRWYEHRTVGTFKAEVKAGYVFGEKRTFCSNWPRLTDGWERSHWNVINIGKDSGTGWSAWWENAGDKHDPDICINVWANPPRQWIRVILEVIAKRKIVPRQTSIPRTLPEGLLEAVQRQLRLFRCPDEPLLKRPLPIVTIAAIEARQRELLELIGRALQKMHTDLEKLNWAVDPRPGEDFARIVASAAHEIECWLGTYMRLEERKAELRQPPRPAS